MAIQFKRKESVRKALKRLGQRQIEQTVKKLDRCDTMDAVHELRQGVKQCRALLRLFQSAVSRADYRRCSGPLRKAAKRLDSARDAHVKVTAVRELADHFKKELPRNAFVRLERRLSAGCRQERERLRKKRCLRGVERLLQKAAVRFASARVEACGWKAIAPGIKRSYGDGRRLLASARLMGRPEHFHDWRKRVKDLYHQVGFLCPIWPEQMRAARAELKLLGQYLGDDHDLFVLAEAGEKLSIGSERESLKALIARRQKELRAEALALGVRFYEEQPSAFCARLRDYWKSWRREPKSATQRA